MPCLTDIRTMLLAKAFLLLYCPLTTKLAYSHTVSLAVNTIISTPRITTSWMTSTVKTVTSNERPLRHTKRTVTSVLGWPKRSSLVIQVMSKDGWQVLYMSSTLIQILQRLQNTTLLQIPLLILATRIDYQRPKRQLQKPMLLRQLKRPILLHSVNFLPKSYT